MHINEDQKLQVLLTELQERYNASHKIRERSTQFTLWISGMAIGLGWLLISQKTFALSQRIALTLLIAALFAGTIYFIMGLRRGSKKNREAMIRCESALGMHDTDAYLEGKSLLPREYSQTDRKWSDHFCTLCVWLILVALSLFILTWTCPDPAKNHSSNIKTQQIKGEKNNG
uniref:Uncharacterized protein n=1 Tax=Candidatus Desulfatibia profunda TaxID=2841695 RepID=A0A8J6TJ02_9BACT|nr:hypothetical protein [Candidatus Desulfatibia profunda]